MSKTTPLVVFVRRKPSPVRSIRIGLHCEGSWDPLPCKSSPGSPGSPVGKLHGVGVGVGGGGGGGGGGVDAFAKQSTRLSFLLENTDDLGNVTVALRPLPLSVALRVRERSTLQPANMQLTM